MTNYYDITLQQALAKSFPEPINMLTVWRKALIKLLFHEFRNMTEQEIRDICEEVNSLAYIGTHGLEAAIVHFRLGR